MNRLTGAGAASILLDLRDNPGGLVQVVFRYQIRSLSVENGALFPSFYCDICFCIINRLGLRLLKCFWTKEIR